MSWMPILDKEKKTPRKTQKKLKNTKYQNVN